MGVRPSVEVHIEELVVEGLPSANGDSIRAVFVGELTRLIAEHGPPPSMTRTVDAVESNVSLQPGTRTETAAIHLARAVYGRTGQ